MDKYSITRFNQAPIINHERTRFDLSHEILKTFNTGELVPILCEPVFPGDTVSLNTASLTRLETSLHQTMDSAYLETAFFFVPSKLVYDHFDEFMGANDDPWTQSNYQSLPQLYLNHNNPGDGQAAVSPGSLLNHLCLPVANYGDAPGTYTGDQYSLSIDLLPLRAVFQVFNDWYRDENLDSIVYFDKGPNNKRLTDKYIFNGSQFDPCTQNLHVNRFKDLFSTALPAPQKAQDTVLNILSGSQAPVLTGVEHDLRSTNVPPMYVRSETGGNLSTGTNSNLGVYGTSSGSYMASLTGSPGYTGGSTWHPTNLWADLSDAAIVTINQLRLAIVRQAIAERDARGGTRMNEQIANIFNVHVNSLEIGRSEFLGGKRFPVSMMEVLQTSETNTTVLGTDAGHSKTIDSSESFVKSFTQYGYILGFIYARTARSYSQGIDRKFFVKNRFDLLDPMLDNIGEVPVYKKELFAIQNNNQIDVPVFNQVFGYQEQYYWLKERSNRFSGYFQPAINGTLDSWHYGDSYQAVPSLSASWLKEDSLNVDRTIAVQSSVSFQWTTNIHFDLYITRTLKKYSIPNSFGF